MKADWIEPFDRFRRVYLAAQQALPDDYNAVTVATVDERGRPVARICLLKDFDPQGFVFFTNYNSRKGRELRANPAVALCFYWPVLAEQVRIEGVGRSIDADESDAYFATRPRISQIGAWASAQSAPLASRAELENRVSQLTAQYEGRDVPRPLHWGGFRVKPDRIEFWKGHAFRLHYRDLYERIDDSWRKSMLNP